MLTLADLAPNQEPTTGTQWAEMDLFFQNKISEPGNYLFEQFFFLNTGNKKYFKGKL